MTVANFFIPNRQLVSNISNDNPAIVTTTQDHGYSSGLIVRFFMPLNVGMNILNNQKFKITVIDDTSFSIPVDSQNFDVYSAIGSVQLAQVIPVGSDQNSVLEPVTNNGNIVPETGFST